jgi:hypothetical protein
LSKSIRFAKVEANVMQLSRLAVIPRASRPPFLGFVPPQTRP